ncbi:hypothetical protein CYY_007552 [Polysphondylium violaceum]|uniref:Uncharacterized protein n=1 Tax=Polysphondylium violaceum TaxID=133409 RepID=A0A8J4PPL2_9MYCE|nr:hypothetical protein CYY_007552 [Polysphondylium violaceum]
MSKPDKNIIRNDNKKKICLKDNCGCPLLHKANIAQLFWDNTSSTSDLNILNLLADHHKALYPEEERLYVSLVKTPPQFYAVPVVDKQKRPKEVSASISKWVKSTEGLEGENEPQVLFFLRKDDSDPKRVEDIETTLRKRIGLLVSHELAKKFCLPNPTEWAIISSSRLKILEEKAIDGQITTAIDLKSISTRETLPKSGVIANFKIKDKDTGISFTPTIENKDIVAPIDRTKVATATVSTTTTTTVATTTEATITEATITVATTAKDTTKDTAKKGTKKSASAKGTAKDTETKGKK